MRKKIKWWIFYSSFLYCVHNQNCCQSEINT
jgi:hypothetical protein